jgi:tetratricopeptide (TPR) repeat protein
MPQRLRIFISSPTDVPDERLRTDLITDKLSQEYGRFFTIESYRWEHEAMLASAHFQDAIEPPSAFDIVVLILWSRLGTPLPEKTAAREYRGIDGRAPVTGTEWEFEEALKAAREKKAPDLLAFRNISAAPMDTRDPDARARSNAQLDALDEFWRLHFADRGVFLAAYDEYRTLAEFAQRLEQSLRKLIERRIKDLTGGQLREAPIWLGEPFRGLESYEFEHGPILFGRDTAVTKAIEQLAANAAAGRAFLLVCGASGSGKSSLVKAGIVPRLMKPGRFSGIEFLRRVVFRPWNEGAKVFDGFAKALTSVYAAGTGLPELTAPGQKLADLAEALRGATANSGYLFANALGRVTLAEREAARLFAFEKANLILVIDQLEELFTSPEITPEDRRLFVQVLSSLARSGHVYVVATLRADFWHRAAEIPELMALAEGSGRIDIAAPSGAEIAEIIRKPATAAGLSFEPHPESGLDLDVILAQDAAAAPGALPLLSFTLDELYKSANGKGETVLTHASYAALGGLEGSIAKRAEETFARLPSSAQSALPRVLRALTGASGAGTQTPIARPVALDTFAAGTPARVVIDEFISARLLVAASDRVATVRLAHEALIGRWQRAKDHLARDQRDLETRRIIEESLKRWQNAQGLNRRRLLLRDPDLANAIDLARRWGDELDPSVRDYVAQSRRHARLTQTLTAAAAVLFAIVSVAAIYAGLRAYHAQMEAESNYQLALDQAAGSVDILNRGFIDGAINSQLMARLIQRGQSTVNQLPGTSDVVTEARVKLLVSMSPAMIAVGAMDSARQYAESAIKLADGLRKKDPNSPEWRRLWADATAALGIELFWAGDSQGARPKAEAAIAEFKQLSGVMSDQTTLSQKLMLCYENLGDSTRAIGDFAAAMTAYHEWLSLAEKLAAANSDPKEADFWLSYAADAHLRIGDMLQQQHKLDEAEAEYSTGVRIASLLTADDRANAKYLEHLSLAHGKLGDVLISSNKLNDAAKEIDLNITLTNTLVNNVSANIRWLIYQEWSHLRKGRVLLVEQEYDQARVEFSLYLDDARAIYQRDPGYLSVLYDEANAHQWIGDAFRAQNNLDAASAEYQESLRVAIDLNDRSPTTNQADRKIMAMAYYRLGLAEELRGKTQDAQASYKTCASIDVNPNSWTPRSMWPEDIDAVCREKLTQLGSAPHP